MPIDEIIRPEGIPGCGGGVITEVERKDLVGSTFDAGRYHVASKLGEGNMGQVFLAQDRRLSTDVVMKVPSAQALADEEFSERFQREIRSLVQLTHPHVVKIIDVGSHEGLPYVVMQYLSGGSLKDTLHDDSGRQLARAAASLRGWLLEVAKALDFMHAEGYVHRDVKPANILFDQHKNAFLSDFGLAKVLANKKDAREEASLTAAGFLVGTPNYVAPELVMGHDYDGMADQYSLAVTVMESLLGYVPFEGASASATMVNQTATKPPVLHEVDATIPKSVSDAVLRALSKNPARRFPSCVAFAEAVLTGIPSGARVRVQPGSAARKDDEPSAAASRGQVGRVPCPKCGKYLPIPAQLAGKKARCAKCKSLLQIGTDRATLRVIPAAGSGRATTRSGRISTAPPPVVRKGSGAGSTGRNVGGATVARLARPSESDVAVIGENIFGMQVSKSIAAALIVSLIVLVTGVALFMGRLSTTADIDDLKRRTLKPGGLESSETRTES